MTTKPPLQTSLSFEHSEALRSIAHRLIPGGAHTYAKGDDQYPVLAPGFITRGKGCFVWDVDGNRFTEYGMGLRAVTLGHACPRTAKAAYEQMLLGNNFTRPAALEVQVAKALLEMVGGPDDMVKFAKNGSDVTTAAVKLARAYTGRDLVAICETQPFFSVDDWFIGTTNTDAGIPAAVKALTVGFRYNDLASVRALFEAHPEQIACLMLEAARNEEPQAGFLEGVQILCREHGVLLILDEMITGFRWHNGGARAYYSLEPDLATYGKGMANGFSVSALVGKREVMELGGLHHDKERVFLLSTTHGAEGPALAAALATFQVYQEKDVIGHFWRQGQRLIEGINSLVSRHDLAGHFGPIGLPCNLAYFTRDADGQPSQAFRTLFLQEMIKRGVLCPSLVVSHSHTDEVIEQTLVAMDGALSVYARALEDGVKTYLVGRPVQPVFRRYNGEV